MVGFAGLSGGDDTGRAGSSGESPTPTPSEPASPPSDVDPTPAPEREPDTPPVPSDGYQHEDYAVPAVGAGPVQVYDPYDDSSLLDANPFYEQQVPRPIRCDATEVDDVRDRAQLQARSTDMMECLTKLYGPTLEDAGFEAYHPRALVYEGTGSSPCGDLEPIGAFYCPANQSIYVSAEISELTNTYVAALDFVIAHEYSHNVQGRNGQLLQRYYEQEKAASSDEVNEVNRRLETQADCYAASAMDAMWESLGYKSDDEWVFEALADVVGDPPSGGGTHGVPESRALWSARGYDADRYGVCNTFVAPSDEVR